MNYYNLFKSKDIAEYYRKRDFSLSATEIAYLIWKDKTFSISERHAAWKELMKTHNDEEIACLEHKTIFHLIRSYMSCEEAMLEQFYYYSTYSFDYRRIGDIEWRPSVQFYNSADEAIEGAKEMEEMLDGSYEWSVCIMREQDGDENIDLDLTPMWTPFNFREKYQRYRLSDMYATFESLCPRILTPFRHGDIVQLPNGQPYVISFLEEITPQGQSTSICQWLDVQEVINDNNCCLTVYTVKKLGQTTPMEKVDMSNCLDFEFFRGELNGSQRVLQSLSAFLKEEIDCATLINDVYRIISEEYRDNILKTIN